MTQGMTARAKNQPIVSPALHVPGLNDAIARSVGSLLSLQHEDGHWVFELEADATIPAEYVLLQHYLGTPEPDIERRIARYLRAAQGPHGGWQLFYGGQFDLSASGTAYFAPTAAGEPLDAPHMERVRAAALAPGRASRGKAFPDILPAL